MGRSYISRVELREHVGSVFGPRRSAIAHIERVTGTKVFVIPGSNNSNVAYVSGSNAEAVDQAADAIYHRLVKSIIHKEEFKYSTAIPIDVFLIPRFIGESGSNIKKLNSISPAAIRLKYNLNQKPLVTITSNNTSNLELAEYFVRSIIDYCMEDLKLESEHGVVLSASGNYCIPYVLPDGTHLGCFLGRHDYLLPYHRKYTQCQFEAIPHWGLIRCASTDLFTAYCGFHYMCMFFQEREQKWRSLGNLGPIPPNFCHIDH